MSLPTPYYQDDAVTLYHGDCREIVPLLGRFDLLLTDPPYGVGENYAGYDDTQHGLVELINTTMPLFLQCAKVIALTSGVKNISLYPVPDWVMAWMTPAGSGCGPFGFCTWQPILCYGKDPYLALGLGSRPDGFLHTESSEVNGHPCPKPIRLWKKVLERFSPSQSDTILDPFAGSGTTGRAAKDLGRKCTLIEREELYCEIAARRMCQEVLAL